MSNHCFTTRLFIFTYIIDIYPSMFNFIFRWKYFIKRDRWLRPYLDCNDLLKKKNSLLIYKKNAQTQR